jgi:hypothetical protein
LTDHHFLPGNIWQSAEMTFLSFHWQLVEMIVGWIGWGKIDHW